MSELRGQLAHPSRATGIAACGQSRMDLVSRGVYFDVLERSFDAPIRRYNVHRFARPFPDPFGKTAAAAARCAVLLQRGQDWSSSPLQLRFFPLLFGVFSELPRLNKGAPASASPENMHR